MAEQFSNLVDLYVRSCAKYASRPLFGSKKGGAWQWVTYGRFAEDVDHFRAGLATLGVGKGDRVAIIADNCVEWAVAAYATYGLEAAFVPMYRAQHLEERRFILEDCAPKVVLVADDALHEGVAAMNLPGVTDIVGLTRPRSDPRSWSALVDAGARAPSPPRTPDPDSIADFIYTSGTTGKPKGVLLSHRNIATNLSALHEIFTFEPDDRSLSFLPWAHAYGQAEVHALLSMGSSIAINDHVDHLLENLGEVRPTILVAVPRIFNRIYEGVNKQIAQRPDYLQRIIRTGIRGAVKRAHGEHLGPIERLELAFDEKVLFAKIRQRFGGRLKYAISASATLGREVAEFVDAIGLVVCEGYGMTETSPIVSANLPGQRRFGSVGRVLPGVRVVIDTSVGPDPKQGEIVVYGPNVMVGYHNRPDEMKKTMMPDGGLRTGDLGYVDEDGFLFITGRSKEQYKLENGRYVMPSPLEEELKLSPFIANAMIYGDGRPFNVVLVVLNVPTIREWATAEKILLAADVTRDERVRSLIEREIALHAKGFKSFERPGAFALITEDFTTENGLLTPTLKLRRRDVVARYGTLLESLYRPAVQRASPSASAPW